jgi:hypothetical protein
MEWKERIREDVAMNIVKQKGHDFSMILSAGKIPGAWREK